MSKLPYYCQYQCTVWTCRRQGPGRANCTLYRLIDRSTQFLASSSLLPSSSLRVVDRLILERQAGREGGRQLPMAQRSFIFFIFSLFSPFFSFRNGDSLGLAWPKSGRVGLVKMRPWQFFIGHDHPSFCLGLLLRRCRAEYLHFDAPDRSGPPFSPFLSFPLLCALH